MNITRRKFLVTGAAAAGAIVSLGGTGLTLAGNGMNAVSRLSWADFQAHLNTDFTFAGTGSTVPLRLVDMEDTRPRTKKALGTGKECFVLKFSGPSKARLSQNTYAVSHSALGMFSLFIAPGPVSKTSQQSYFAVINRLTS